MQNQHTEPAAHTSHVTTSSTTSSSEPTAESVVTDEENTYAKEIIDESKSE